MNRAVGFWLAVLLVFAGGMMLYFARHTVGGNRPGSALRPDAGADAAGGPTLAEFELTDQSGKRMNSNELEGKVWGGSFFFASCPSTCYNQNIKLQQLLDKYAERGLVLVSITCDPANDTPSSLAQYSARFNASPMNWKFLTTPDGGLDYLRKIARDFFGVAIEEETHSDRLIIFGRDGQPHGAFSVLNAEQFRQADETLHQLLIDAGTSGIGDKQPASDPDASQTALEAPLH